MLNAANQRSLKRLIRFFSREDENGYIFAYADKTAQIKGINATIQQHFEQLKQKIGLFFYNKYQDVTLIEQLKIFNKEHKYQGIIVANLYEPISDTEHARRNITEINFAREQFHALDTPIIFWITQEIYPQLINKANDLYSQRRLPSIVFEAEQSVAQQDPIKYSSQDIVQDQTQNQVATSSTKLKIIEQQFQKALTLDLSDKELVNDYLIDYLLELSKHNHKQKVLTLYQKHQNAIKPLIEKNSQQLGEIFDNIHDYTKAIEFYSLYIKAQKFNHQQLALTLLSRSDVYRVIGELKAALKNAERAKEIMLELCNQSPDNKLYSYTLGLTHSRLGDLNKDLGNNNQALQHFETAINITKTLLIHNPSSSDFKNVLTISYGKLSQIHKDLGNLNLALESLGNVLVQAEELWIDNPRNLDFKHNLAITYEKIGETYHDLGNINRALQAFEYENKLFQELYKENPNNTAYVNGLAISYEKLGDIHNEIGSYDKSLKYITKDLYLMKKLLKENPNNIKFKNGLAVSYYKLGEVYLYLNKGKNFVIQPFQECKKLLEEIIHNHPEYVDFQNNLEVTKEKIKQISSQK